MKEKTFDCVEMKRKGAEAVAKVLKDRTVEEQKVFWQKKTELLRIQQAKQRGDVTPTAKR